MNAVEPVDFYNAYAHFKFGVSAAWRWHSLSGKTIGGRDIFCVSGAVCDAKFKIGPRRGITNWAKADKSTALTFSVAREEFEAFKLKWEAEAGSCRKCFGTGLEGVGWSVEAGRLTAPCEHADSEASS